MIISEIFGNVAQDLANLAERSRWADIEEIAMHTLGTFAIVIPAPVKIPNIITFNLVEFRRFLKRRL